MKIFIICSKVFYDRIPPIQAELEAAGHEVTLPNSYDDPGAEARLKQLGEHEHATWKATMLRHSTDVIKGVDAVLVLNFEKNEQPNYIGGATFLEMYDAFRHRKKIYVYNELPDSMPTDEIAGFAPVVLRENLHEIPNGINNNKFDNTVVQGRIPYETNDRPTDYLFRISLKSVILNPSGEVLVVKEAGRDWWDLPGGGMDHGESVYSALARELKEEISLASDFSYRAVLVEDPTYLENLNFYQTRIVFHVKPDSLQVATGEDSDELQFVNPMTFKDSAIATERKIYAYVIAATSA